jgi:hypothetical protein
MWPWGRLAFSSCVAERMMEFQRTGRLGGEQRGMCNALHQRCTWLGMRRDAERVGTLDVARRRGIATRVTLLRGSVAVPPPLSSLTASEGRIKGACQVHVRGQIFKEPNGQRPGAGLVGADARAHCNRRLARFWANFRRAVRMKRRTVSERTAHGSRWSANAERVQWNCETRNCIDTS